MYILAILDRPETASFTLETTAELARRLGCTDIRGLHPQLAEDPAFQSPDEGMPSDGERKRFAQAVSARAESLRRIFQHWTQDAGLVGTSHWIEIAGDVRRIVAREAASADMVVLSRPRADDPAYVSQAFAGALYDARATVVVAPLQHHDTVGSHPIIAWHPAENLERALAAARPLLEKARTVTVIIGERRAGEVADPLLVSDLRAQGVAVSVERFVITSPNVGEDIRKHALASGGDLLVMGAYSHAHFLEWLFGGPTQDLLTHATLPLLTHH
ncbi:universal stress protein [Acetobacter conturbans]|uniref:Universal stress protein n=1 Tax=Acetobacter conturbans TaxID=1737472 RepID=A0ABX0JWT8_9PROT|nr:universal stress protein [Acetobacter conturbans]NHN87961.1 universal stress protein [Acetobacter conturbans]